MNTIERGRRQIAREDREACDYPRIWGVSRDAENDRTLILYFNHVPTDDEIRAIHNKLNTP